MRFLGYALTHHGHSGQSPLAVTASQSFVGPQSLYPNASQTSDQPASSVIAWFMCLQATQLVVLVLCMSSAFSPWPAANCMAVQEIFISGLHKYGWTYECVDTLRSRPAAQRMGVLEYTPLHSFTSSFPNVTERGNQAELVVACNKHTLQRNMLVSTHVSACRYSASHMTSRILFA